MCGIAGIFDPDINPTKDEVYPMVEIIKHRGPDADGYFMKDQIGMGMRRLAIIDLKTGNQPISNEDNTVTVVFNGEIYNYLELRKQLIDLGYKFKTNTDTEVLLHMYSEYDLDMLSYLNGMFAFAIWNNETKTLFVARDRMGIKPLYYARIGRRILFASELKCLLTCSALDRSLDMDAISDYLRLGYVPRQETPFQAVRKLLPGHFLIADKHQFQIKEWWNLEEIHRSGAFQPTQEYESETVNLFDSSVEFRMRSDVPVASFLSGGLDSSLISVTASKLSPIKLQTYNVRFADALFDESSYATTVAEQANTDHHQITVSAGDALEKLPLLVWHMDEPIADSAIIPNFLVSQFAANQVKVCLSGLGGDELFGGYSRYIDKPLGPYRRFFSKFPWLIRTILPLLKITHPRHANRLAPLSGPGEVWRNYLNQIQLFDSDMLRKMNIKEMGQTEKIIKDLWFSYPGEDDIGRRQFIDQQTYLPDQILALTDRMSMAVSLEVRVPFLDHRLLGSITNLPEFEKQTQNGDFKIWLKKILGHRVPPEILERRKWGFDAPVLNWIEFPKIKEVITHLPKQLSNIMDSKYIESLIQNKTNPRYHNLVWSLLMLAVWQKVYKFDDPPDLTLHELFC